MTYYRSDEMNEMGYESSLEEFWELLEDYDLQCLIYEYFLDSQEQWKEKEFGFNDSPYNNFFEHMIKWDPELVSHNIKTAVMGYIEKLKNDRLCGASCG